MISIIIPTYNRASGLKKCVDSILKQYYEGLEIVVVDDFSQDQSRNYLQEVSAQNNFIRVIYNEMNQGVNFSRNRGIEIASNPFILFLDSDDELAVASLQKVKNSVEQNPGVDHFLFVVSDRAEEFACLTRPQNRYYRDWVSGDIQGDFTHVVKTSVMKKNLFFEQFRTFEHLNWLRIKKQTSPQLLTPAIVACRERNREDSLTFTMKLKDPSRIRSKFESEKLFYSLYYSDLRQYNPKSLTSQLIQAIMLGTACGQRRECRSLVKYAGRMHVRLLAFLIMLLPPSFLEYGIVKYSLFKEKRIA